MKKTSHKIHLWLSIPLGIVITVICFTGAMLVFEQEITRALNRHLYEVEIPQGKERLNLSEIMTTVRNAYPEMEISSVRIPSSPEETYQVSFSNGGKKTLFLNPYTGEDTGWSKSYPFFQTMRKLHRWLLDAPETKGSMSAGKFIVGVSTIAMTVILITGLVIWIPRSRKALKNRLSVACGKGTGRFMYDSHVALGFYATAFLLIMSLTGPTWSFGRYRKAAYALLGAETQKHAPERGDVGNKENKRQKDRQDNFIAYDTALKEIQGRYGKYNYIRLGKGEASVVLSGNGSRMKSDNIRFDPVTGKITEIKRFEDSSFRQNMKGFIYSLHVGTWGGYITKVLYFLAALTGATLPLTGYYLWFKKKRKNKHKKIE